MPEVLSVRGPRLSSPGWPGLLLGRGLLLLGDDGRGLRRRPVGLPQEHDAARGAGYGAVDEDEVLVLRDFDDVEVPAGDLLVSPVAGHLLAGIDALGDRVL